jgi:archaellum biogenesis protein FlaJ (TadC family)
MKINKLEVFKEDAGITSNLTGIMVGMIILVAVVVPIVADVIDTQNFSGINATIAGVITPLLLVGGVILATMFYNNN